MWGCAGHCLTQPSSIQRRGKQLCSSRWSISLYSVWQIDTDRITISISFLPSKWAHFWHRSNGDDALNSKVRLVRINHAFSVCARPVKFELSVLGSSFQKRHTVQRWITTSLTNNWPRMSAPNTVKVRLVVERMVDNLDIRIYLWGFHLHLHGHEHRSWSTYSLFLCTQMLFRDTIFQVRDDSRTFNPFVVDRLARGDIRIARS